MIAARADGFTLVWTEPHGAQLQTWPLDAVAPGALHEIALPERTVVTEATSAPNDSTALVIRTSANRYWIATVDAHGVRHWPRSAPAGCEHNRCPTVHLLATPTGLLATWFERPLPDEMLRAATARVLDGEGHLAGAPVHFIPMLHAIVVAAPGGEPLAIQLARPIVVRGATRPFAIDGSDLAAGTTLAFGAMSVLDRERIEVVAASEDGALVRARVRCAER